MKKCAPLITLACCVCFLRTTSFAQQVQLSSQRDAPEIRAAQQLQKEFFSDFNLETSSAAADQVLDRYPGNITALFIRMETAALRQQTESVLDAALRLCTMPAPPEIQEIASSRILENAGNSRAFDDVLQRVGLAMEEGNACTFNLRLAIVAAAADGARRLDLDKTADSAGLLTHWRIAGPFGRFSYLDFGRRWPAESDDFWQAAKSRVEQFWFRDGMVPVPEGFPSAGVYYAASSVRTGNQGASQLDVLSPGPYTIFVDGRTILSKDSRYAIGGNRESLILHLRPGRHRIMVKFTADAAPFSVDLHPVFARRFAEAPTLSLSDSFNAYLRALLAYFRGDLNQVEQIIASVPNQDGGPFLYIRALLWSAVDDHSSRAVAAWEALKRSQPAATLARIKAAEFALQAGSTPQTRAEIEYLVRRRPDSEAVNELSLRVAQDSGARSLAYARLLSAHPSCAHLREALKFYNSQSNQPAAQNTELQLSRCAPESVDYARVLADSGRHKDAAIFLEQKLAHNPLDRGARRMLVEQLVLSSALNQAKVQADRLRRLAPGNPFYASMAADPWKVLDSNSARTKGFIAGAEFYAKYRRDGMELVREAVRDKNVEGKATVILLADHILKIEADGAASLYSHRVVRLLNRKAIRQYGQITLPRDAELLELRTIKADGRVIEPELTNQKPSISMPALDPGDSIDEEFVSRYPDWLQLPSGSLLFEFGSAEAPVMRSRLVLIAPKAADIEVEQRNGMLPPTASEITGDELVRVWQMEYLAPLASEPFSTHGMLPAIDVTAADPMDRLREALIESTRIGPHVMEAVLSQKRSADFSEREKARRLYRLVTARIESTGPDFAADPAEDSLAAGEGSRTAVLLAMARATGIKAALLLARKIGRECAPNVDCYNIPLVRFRIDGEIVDADAEADDRAFGALPFDLDSRRALLIAPAADDVHGGAVRPELVALSMNPSQEQSRGEGDLFLDRRGNLSATIRVRLGAARSQQIRTALRIGGDNELQRLLQQLAGSIFTGAVDVHGSAIHAADPDQALEVTLHCQVPQFINLQAGSREIGQLAPLLRLPPSPASGIRRSPLFLNSVLAESTVFHLHLPAGISAGALPRDFAVKSDFGDYAVTYSQTDGQINVTRQFDVPVQVVKPGRFTAFLAFARQIEQAERQQIILKIADRKSERNPPPSAAAE
ncbi:MAG TPA: DUF3857 domain-containing protein [Candidatus Angelobacter sp.]|nr:DUF3857 domain-containing protein [Candidatus Angelobacter sp.]